MTAWKPSRYNIFVGLQDRRRLAYNSASGALAVWEAEDGWTYELASQTGRLDTGDPSARAIVQGGWLVREDTDELAELQRSYHADRFDMGHMILTIAPTLACNFGCDYCFQGQNKPSQTMSEQVQDAIVAMAERAAPRIRRLHVAWYGGEPTLRMKIIESLSDRLMTVCREQGVSYDAMMVTNGWRLTADVARSLHERKVNTIQVTLDGSQHAHDGRRVLLSGKGTYKRIVDNLTASVEAVPTMLSIRVNVDSRNAGDVHELIDDMHARGLSGRKNLAMYFAPVESITEGCHAVADVTMAKDRYGKLEVGLYEHAYDKQLTGLPYPPRFRGNCAAVKPRGFVVVPSGDLHKCWDTVNWPERAVGTIFDLDALSTDERVARWMRWTPFGNDACRNCKILPNCSGACAYKFLHAEATRGEQAILPCPSWKYNLKERLVLRALKAGDIGEDDVLEGARITRPDELCAEEHLPGGTALPVSMAVVIAGEAARISAK